MAEKPKEKPSVEFEITDSTLKYLWKTPIMKKELLYLLEKCAGCGLCLICPWEAVTIGPIVEVASGRLKDAPLVNIDQDKCTFCGICDAVCALNSIKMSINGMRAENSYASIRGLHTLDREKCLPCLLCSKTCPRGAIEVKVEIPKKEDLVKYEGETGKVEGTITVDEEKCCYCGICELLCDAFKIYWSDPKPPDYKPALNIVVDREKCDYCGLCEKICPSEAVKVKCEKAPPRKIIKPILRGDIKVDKEKCVDCGICTAVCPVDAVSVTKPLKGKVELVKLEKCDPVGCKNCFNICPTKCIYPPKTEKKVEVILEHCIFCGACELACPEHVIKVSREGFNLVGEDKGKPWEENRRRILEVILGKPLEAKELRERLFKIQPEPYNPMSELNEEKWVASRAARSSLKDRLDLAMKILCDRTSRMAFEAGNMEKVLKNLKQKA